MLHRPDQVRDGEGFPQQGRRRQRTIDPDRRGCDAVRSPGRLGRIETEQPCRKIAAVEGIPGPGRIERVGKGDGGHFGRQSSPLHQCCPRAVLDDHFPDAGIGEPSRRFRRCAVAIKRLLVREGGQGDVDMGECCAYGGLRLRLVGPQARPEVGIERDQRALSPRYRERPQQRFPPRIVQDRQCYPGKIDKLARGQAFFQHDRIVGKAARGRLRAPIGERALGAIQRNGIEARMPGFQAGAVRNVDPVLGHEGDLAGRKGIGAEGGDEIGADIFRHQCAQHPQRVERVTGVAQSPAGISRGQLDHAFANARNGFQSRIPYLPPS